MITNLQAREYVELWIKSLMDVFLHQFKGLFFD